MIPRVLIRLRHNPRRRIRDAQIQHLARLNHIVQRQHNFLDTGRVLPPVNVEDIDIVSLESPQRVLQTETHGFGAVAGIVGLDLDALVRDLERRGVLRCDHHLIPNPASGHPFTDQLFGVAVLVFIGGVEEVASSAIELFKSVRDRISGL
jgi:hypothetical protein